MVPFNAKFMTDHEASGECQPGHLHADPKLDQKLWAEREGILSWAVKGAIEWQRQGLAAPDAVLVATESYREEADALREFLESKCVLGLKFTGRSGVLYEAYKSWASDEGLIKAETLSHKAFGSRMSTRFEKRKTRIGAEYLGVGLVSDSYGQATR